MATDTYVLSRVNYYDGEFLKVAEFQDEQSYHADRRRRHDRLLHVAGVAEGLDVSQVDQTTVRVTAGTAIDDQGEQILLSADATATVTSGLNGSFSIVISFVEKPDHPADQNSTNPSMTRVTQYPAVSIMTTPVPHAVVLGTVVAAGGKVTQVTRDGRTWSGLSLPGLGSTGYLRPRDGAAAGVAELGCSLSVKGSITTPSLTASGAVAAGSLTVGTISASGGITAGGVAATGSITAGSFSTSGALSAGTVTASGAVTAGSLGTSGAVNAGTVTAGGAVTAGSLSTSGAVNAGTVTATGALTGGSLNTSGAVSAGTVKATGALSAGSISTSGAVSAGTISTSGAISAGSVSAGSIASTGAVTGASISTGGAVSAGSISTSGAVSAGTVSATGAVSAGSISTSGAISAGSISVNAGVAASSLTVTGTRTYLSGFETVSGFHWIMVGGTTEGTNNALGFNFKSKIVVNAGPGWTKGFAAHHPLDPENKYLLHAVLEGPESGVYYRGEAQLSEGRAEIELPAYFEALTRREGITILVTPRCDGDEPVSGLAASTVGGGRFVVRAVDGRNPAQRFWWEVKAVRADVPLLQTETDKASS